MRVLSERVRASYSATTLSQGFKGGRAHRRVAVSNKQSMTEHSCERSASTSVDKTADEALLNEAMVAASVERSSCDISDRDVCFDFVSLGMLWVNDLHVVCAM